ncbi:helix-turn-helix domain-containing protein [Chondrinema litorale]|uniref:helix-turn-helix domain-containing protein n=1 Tax=Chondrinema litorale TaxID=2994555 RepID=UPI0025436C4D|nr:helix-turn-helix domain-containing protein [Chondrinema litorale]UZS00077.1 helix-turn-helix domain-containing protein [Chondrinema litorale]
MIGTKIRDKANEVLGKRYRKLLSEKLNLSERTITNIFNSEDISVKRLEQICSCLGCSVCYFFLDQEKDIIKFHQDKEEKYREYLLELKEKVNDNLSGAISSFLKGIDNV